MIGVLRTYGGYVRAAAQTRLRGDSPSDSLLRFAAVDVVLRLKHIFQREPVSIAECFAFCSETTFFVKGYVRAAALKPA